MNQLIQARRRAAFFAPVNTLDTAAYTATLRGLTVKFDNMVEAATPIYGEFCTEVPSVRKSEGYGFLGNMPGVREWLGDRVFNRLKGARFAIENRLWESSLEIEKTDLEDDVLNMYGPILEQMGVEAAYHPDELLFEAIVAGDSAECFDGQYFFDTDHSWGDSGTQSNKLSIAITDRDAPTEDEARTAWHQARNAILNFKRDNGKLWYRPTVKPFQSTLILPASLTSKSRTYEEVFTKALTRQFANTDGISNVILDAPRIMGTGYLTDPYSFYVFVTQNTPLRPFVFQKRRPLQRQMKGLDDRESKVVKFMTDARYALGYLAWWRAVKVTLSTKSPG